jgi:CysZ protein
MSNPFTGFLYFFQGMKLIFAPGVRRYVVIPLAINILLFAALIWFGASQFQVFMHWLMPELPDWLQFLEWLFWILFGISALLILFFTFSLLANIIGGPFNELLAEAVEFQLTGERPEDAGGMQKLLANIVPSMIDETKKLLYMVLWSIPFLILFLIPVVNIVAPFIWIVFSAWMLTIEYTDYPMGNHGLRSDEQKQRLRGKRFLSLGFGGAVTIATIIPVLNFLVMPSAVAGATAMWVNQFKNIRET